MKISYALFNGLFLLLFTLTVQAQNELSGTIVNKENTPLEAVSVYIPDLKTGTVTNKEGKYILKNIPQGNWLVEFSLIGHRSHAEKLTIKGATHLNYSLVATSYELNEVVVTGASTATVKRENPIPISVLGKAEMLENSATNIIDAISIIPGVSQITLGPSISKPTIRGLGYNRVVVMNDGVRQEGQQWFDEFGIEIDENSVNKVEVMKGPASLRYGSDAMAGVINFIGPLALPEGQVKGNLMANYQTNNGLINGSANFAGTKKGFSWNLLYSGLAAHNYKNKYDGYVWNSGYSENNLKGVFDISKKWGYSNLSLSMFNLKLGVIEGARDSATGKFDKHYLASDGSDSLGLAPESEYKSYNNYPIIHQHIRHYKAVWDNSFVAGKGRVNLRIGLQYNLRQEANDITKGDIYNNYFFLRTINYDLQHVLGLKNKWEVSYGVNGMQQSSEDRGIVFVLPEYNLFDFGVYAIAKKTFNKLTVTGGLRFDSRSLHGKSMYTDSSGARIAEQTNSSIERFSDYRSNFTGFSGSIGLTYDFSEMLYGKLNLARGYRAPTAAESGQNGIHDGTPFYEIGDHNLKPENSLQLDATLGLNSDNISAELNLFTNRINNYIFPAKLESAFGGDSIRSDFVAGFSGPTFKYISGDAVLSGGEIMVDIHPKNVSWFDFETAYSTVSAIQLNQPEDTKHLPYTPPSKWQSKLKVVFPKLNSILQHLFASISVDHYFEQNKIYYQFGNETVTPGYSLINLAAGSEIHAKNKTICSIYLGVNNLADVAYQSNMSRLKYTDPNNVTGRIGVYNMGRNFSLKLIVPIDFSH
jgi:iron complex outermembrane receptor protein